MWPQDLDSGQHAARESILYCFGLLASTVCARSITRFEEGICHSCHVLKTFEIANPKDVLECSRH